MSVNAQNVMVFTPEGLGDYIEERIRKALGLSTSDQLFTLPNSYPPVNSLPEVMTREQVKDYLGVSLVTLHTWAKDTPDRPAVLVPFKVGHRVRYRREDVLAAFKQTRRYQPKKG